LQEPGKIPLPSGGFGGGGRKKNEQIRERKGKRKKKNKVGRKTTEVMENKKGLFFNLSTGGTSQIKGGGGEGESKNPLKKKGPKAKGYPWVEAKKDREWVSLPTNIWRGGGGEIKDLGGEGRKGFCPGCERGNLNLKNSDRKRKRMGRIRKTKNSDFGSGGGGQKRENSSGGTN